MSMQHLIPTGAPALVCKSAYDPTGPSQYLRLSELGDVSWTLDPEAATSFASMREAARMALRLPAAVRAYGLPREVEVHLHTMH